MRVYDNILDVIGNTPIVRLNKIFTRGCNNVYAKLEFMNPGGSIKDRMAKYIVGYNTEKGLINTQTTIVENSSGNTGTSLAMISAILDLKCIITIPDKMSKEKINKIKSFGGEVVVTPTNVSAESAESYYSVAKRISENTFNSYYPDQYNNILNSQAHYLFTAPEIWEQMNGNIDVLICGIGTGGTISGIGKYLKEKNKDIKVIAVDPVGSIFYDYFYSNKIVTPDSYKVEGIGEDYLVNCIDFSVIDEIVQINDSESFLCARSIARKEGILCGGSSGSVVAGLDKIIDRFNNKNILLIFPDSGTSYLSKFHDDDWMENNNFTV